MAKQEFCAPIAQDILVSGSISVLGTAGSTYTNHWVLSRSSFFGIEVQFSSDTDVDVKIDLEQSNYKPANDGAASDDFVVAIDSIGTVTDENVHLFPVAPVVSVYGRLKLTAQSSNSATTTKLVRANWVVVEA